MINIPITKILFIDIETVGGCPDLDTCENFSPKVSEQFHKYFDWFLKRFPEDNEIKVKNIDELKNEVFKKRASLVPEFAKIICVSAAFVLDNGEVKKQTFYNNNERDLLWELQKLLIRCETLGFFLCGHNLKNFDIPMLAKRMIINGLKPHGLPKYDTKPWEIRAIDTKEIWQYGSYSSIGSLDLLCASLDIESSKDGEITGDKVHKAYWEESKLEEISKYCEKDVMVLTEIIKKLNTLK